MIATQTNDRTQALLNHMGVMRVEVMIANQVKTGFNEMIAADLNRRGVKPMRRWRARLLANTVLASWYNVH